LPATSVVEGPWSSLSRFTGTCRGLGIDSQLDLAQLIASLIILKQDEFDLWLQDVWNEWDMSLNNSESLAGLKIPDPGFVERTQPVSVAAPKVPNK
jgi:hypothetical protein